MKSLLICPAERENVAALGEDLPLALVPILGKTLVEYWLEHLVATGAKEVLILSSDRSQKIAAHVGDGARWGLRVTVQNEVAERTAGGARAKFLAADDASWQPSPDDDVILMDRLPQAAKFPLFTSYANWFAALMAWLPRAATPERIGIHQIKPGVWAGLRTRIAPGAELHAPCWIGDNVHIGDGAIIGPNAVIEEKTFIEPRANISDSHIGAQTFVGAFTNIEHSLALGSTLVDWKGDSVLAVPDTFLLCSLEKPRTALTRLSKLPQPAQQKQLQPALSWKFNVKTEL